MAGLIAFLLVCLFLGFIASVVIVLTVLAKFNHLEKRVRYLEKVGVPLTESSSPGQQERSELPNPSTPTVPQTAIPPKKKENTFQPSIPKLKEGWEWFVGGKLLNRIGALALIIGVSFFLKYAFDHEWITESMRVLMGGAVGTALLILGEKFRKKKLTVFAQGVVGAGISINYLAIYASFNFYHLIPQQVALLLMVLVTALSFQQALRHDSLAVTLLGWIGGFLTPFLLPAEEASETKLFSYITLLTIGVLWVSLKKKEWVSIPPLTLAAVYFIWFAVHTESDQPLLLFGFLTLFWGMFVAVEVFLDHQPPTSRREIRRGSAAVNGLAYLAGVYSLFHPQHDDWTGWIYLGIGAVYILLSRKANLSTAFQQQYDIAAFTLFGLTVPLWFSPFPSIIFWSMGALLLIWLGIKQQKNHFWMFALLLYAVSTLQLLLLDETWWFTPLKAFQPVWNIRTLAFLVLAGTLAAGSILIRRLEKKQMQPIQSSLQTGWILLLFPWLTVETTDGFRILLTEADGKSSPTILYIYFMVLVGVWLLYALPLVWRGLKKQIHSLLYIGLTAFSLSLFTGIVSGAKFVPLSAFIPVLNLRFLMLALITISLFAIKLGIQTTTPQSHWLKKGRIVFSVLAVLVLFELLTVETGDFYRKILAQVPSDDKETLHFLSNLKQSSLSGIWLLYSVTLMVVGIWRRIQNLRVMSMGLFGITIFKIMIVDLSFLDTLYRIFSFIGLGTILLSVSYLYQKYKKRFLSAN